MWKDCSEPTPVKNYEDKIESNCLLLELCTEVTQEVTDMHLDKVIETKSYEAMDIIAFYFSSLND